MPRTLVISDVHLQPERAEEWIARLSHRHDRVVFLGDYFDSHGAGNGPEPTAATASWLAESLKRPERVHLVGNHDLSYLLHRGFTACSGYSEENQAVLAPYLSASAFDRLQPAVAIDGWLLSHAGVHRQLVKDLAPETVLPLIQEQWEQLKEGGCPPLFGCGYSRGGPQPYGGITWQDFGEFRPTPGLNQIFAHTPAKTVRVHWMLPQRRHILKRAHRLDREPGEVVGLAASSTVNVCADTELESVLLLENGALTFFSESLPGGQLIVRAGA